MHLPIFNTAKAHIKGGKEYPNIDGIVSFRETKEGILLTAKISNLPKSNTHCKRKILRISHP